MIVHYANPYDRRPFWRVREDDGRPRLIVRSAESSDGARRWRTLSRHLLALRRVEGRTVSRVITTVYVASDDSEAHWQLFLLVAAVAIVVAIKAFVEREALSKETA